MSFSALKGLSARVKREIIVRSIVSACFLVVTLKTAFKSAPLEDTPFAQLSIGWQRAVLWTHLFFIDSLSLILTFRSLSEAGKLLKQCREGREDRSKRTKP